MTNTEHELTVTEAVTLLTHYGFEITGYTVEELIETWLMNYKSIWLRLAVIEALYQGRYKAISVEQILNFWLKKGYPLYHFTKEFERLICKDITLSFSYSSQVNDLENEENLIENQLENIENIEINNQNQNNQTEDQHLVKTENNLEHSIMIESDVIKIESNQNQDNLINFPDQTPTSTNILNEDINSITIIDDSFAKQPIHKFEPPLDSSQFFLRLKELVKQNQENK